MMRPTPLNRQRLNVRPKAMTVCIARMWRHPRKVMPIIAVSDSSLSIFGGSFSADSAVFKAKDIREDWYVMFSGPTSPMVPIIEGVKAAVKKINQVDAIRQIALAANKAYRAERKTIIETDILSDHEIEKYSDYVALKHSKPDLFATITKSISDEEGKWGLLLFGFIKNVPHLLEVREGGKIRYCDM